MNAFKKNFKLKVILEVSTERPRSACATGACRPLWAYLDR